MGRLGPSTRPEPNPMRFFSLPTPPAAARIVAASPVVAAVVYAVLRLAELASTLGA